MYEHEPYYFLKQEMALITALCFFKYYQEYLFTSLNNTEYNSRHFKLPQ